MGWNDPAHGVRRAFFREYGATATDHGVPSARTVDLAAHEKQALLDKALSGTIGTEEAGQFRAQMLTEMAALSAEDGMVMQLHAGVRRSTDPALLTEYGPNLGADIPAGPISSTDWRPAGALRERGKVPADSLHSTNHLCARAGDHGWLLARPDDRPALVVP